MACRSICLSSTTILLLAVNVFQAQELQIPFDSQGKVLEIVYGSPYAKIWVNEIPEFNRLLAFDADSAVVIEVYKQQDGGQRRFRREFTKAFFFQKRQELDTLMITASRQGAPATSEELDDLRTTFTNDQTGYSAFHGFTLATLIESGASFLIFTGGSYFVISSISDHLDLTRSNVEAARYGHLTGLFQGYAFGVALVGHSSMDVKSTVKEVLALTSIGGISNAVASYGMMNGPGVNPTTQYLRLVAERHSLLWGAGISLLAGGDHVETQAVMGTAVGVSLSSLLWSEPVFGLAHRNMSWGDALLADEFMTPWYLTLTATVSSLKISGRLGAGAVLLGGGVGGFMLGTAINEGGRRELPTVRRTRLLTYGGSLVGLGIAAAGKFGQNATLWTVAGSTMAGYFVGLGSGKGGQSGLRIG